MSKIGIGVVGSGGMGTRRAETFSKLEGCELVAVSSRNRETGSMLAQKLGVPFEPEWKAVMADPNLDAVVICTSNESHGEIALSALEAGKHVFMEYPLARHLDEGERAVRLAKERGLVLRVAHSESISPGHQRIKQEVEALGSLLTAIFVRLTPGRGARPEILFNLRVSGPPALFFVYYIYPAVDLFGPAAWVEGGAEYEGLREDRRYNRFVNTVQVGFRNGGLGQWVWAGGIEIHQAEEYRRFVLTGGTLVENQGRWIRSTREGAEALEMAGEGRSLEELFLEEMEGKTSVWRDDAERALEAVRISLKAEQSMEENRRILLPRA